MRSPHVNTRGAVAQGGWRGSDCAFARTRHQTAHIRHPTLIASASEMRTVDTAGLHPRGRDEYTRATMSIGPYMYGLYDDLLAHDHTIHST